MVTFRIMRLDQMKSNRKSLPSKFPRHDPDANLERAEQALFEEMEGAAELLQSQEDFGRFGVRHALHACYSFLHVRGLSGQPLKPLMISLPPWRAWTKVSYPRSSIRNFGLARLRSESGPDRPPPAKPSFMLPPAWMR